MTYQRPVPLSELPRSEVMAALRHIHHLFHSMDSAAQIDVAETYDVVFVELARELREHRIH